MKKTILSYLLACIEELNDEELAIKVLELADVIIAEADKDYDEVLEYILILIYNYKGKELATKIKRLYSPIQLYIEDDKTNS